MRSRASIVLVVFGFAACTVQSGADRPVSDAGTDAIGMDAIATDAGRPTLFQSLVAARAALAAGRTTADLDGDGRDEYSRTVDSSGTVLTESIDIDGDGRPDMTWDFRDAIKTFRVDMNHDGVAEREIDVSLTADDPPKASYTVLEDTSGDGIPDRRTSYTTDPTQDSFDVVVEADPQQTGAFSVVFKTTVPRVQNNDPQNIAQTNPSLPGACTPDQAAAIQTAFQSTYNDGVDCLLSSPATNSIGYELAHTLLDGNLVINCSSATGGGCAQADLGTGAGLWHPGQAPLPVMPINVVFPYDATACGGTLSRALFHEALHFVLGPHDVPVAMLAALDPKDRVYGCENMCYGCGSLCGNVKTGVNACAQCLGVATPPDSCGEVTPVGADAGFGKPSGGSSSGSGGGASGGPGASSGGGSSGASGGGSSSGASGGGSSSGGNGGGGGHGGGHGGGCSCTCVGCAHSTGDPHLFTWSRVRYDFQQVGEYVLVDDGAGLLVQVRQAPRPGSQSVAVDVAVAARLGSTRVALYASNPPAFKIDGFPLSFSGTLDLPGGAQVVAQGSAYQFIWASGDELDATVNTDHLDLSLTLSSTAASRTLSGLLGNGTDNQFVARGGAALARPVQLADLYHQFGDSWRISDAESLLDYGPGESTATFTDKTFPHANATTGSLGTSDYAAAAQICAAAGVTDPILLDACILDWSQTHDPSYTTWESSVPAPAGAIYTAYYRNDFEAAVGSEWSSAATSVAPGSGGRPATQFLGPLGNQAVTLTLSNLPSHDAVSVAFDLYAVGAWTGNSPATTWNLSAGAANLTATSFSNGSQPQAFPDLYPGATHPAGTDAIATNVLGLGSPDAGSSPDAVYHQQFTFTHLDPTLAIQFSAAGLGGIASASWGLDNVEVELERTSAVTEDVVDGGSKGQVTVVHGAPGDPAAIGCADGRREAFIDAQRYPTIAGCEATWTNSANMRAAPTGVACGDGIGPCASPADACASGWHVCGSSGAVSELRAVSPLECANAGGGMFVSALSHCGSQTSCVYDMTATANYACYPSGWCSEAVCCGSTCTRFGACPGGVWTDWTHITESENNGCGATVAPAAGGVLCCSGAQAGDP